MEHGPHTHTNDQPPPMASQGSAAPDAARPRGASARLHTRAQASDHTPSRHMQANGTHLRGGGERQDGTEELHHFEVMAGDPVCDVWNACVGKRRSEAVRRRSSGHATFCRRVQGWRRSPGARCQRRTGPSNWPFFWRRGRRTTSNNTDACTPPRPIESAMQGAACGDAGPSRPNVRINRSINRPADGLLVVAIDCKAQSRRLVGGWSIRFYSGKKKRRDRADLLAPEAAANRSPPLGPFGLGGLALAAFLQSIHVNFGSV